MEFGFGMRVYDWLRACRRSDRKYGSQDNNRILPNKPWTTKAIIFVGSSDKALYRNYKEPTRKMGWVVEGTGMAGLTS